MKRSDFLLILAVALAIYYLSRDNVKEHLDASAAGGETVEAAVARTRATVNPAMADEGKRNIQNAVPVEASSATLASFKDDFTLGVNTNDPKYANAPAAGSSAAAAAAASDRKPLKPEDLLPKEKNPDWFENPNSDFNVSRAISMEVPDFKFGIDTIGQSLKNASWDIRGTPPNPKVTVGPWNNSTIEPDYNLRGLC